MDKNKNSEDQDKLRRELTDFIIQRSWECMDGVLSDVLILDALEMAEKYHNLVLVRKSASRLDGKNLFGVHLVLG